MTNRSDVAGVRHPTQTPGHRPCCGAPEAVTDAMIEAACQARCQIPGVHWADGMTEGVASIERMLAEASIRAALARTQKGGEI